MAVSVELFQLVDILPQPQIQTENLGWDFQNF